MNHNIIPGLQLLISSLPDSSKVQQAFFPCLVILILKDTHQVFSISEGLRVWLVPLNMFKFSNMILLNVLRRYFFGGSFLLFIFHVCFYYAVLSVPCSLVITCWDISCVMFCCVLITFPYSVSGQVWYLIVSIPEPAFFFTLMHSIIVGFGIYGVIPFKIYQKRTSLRRRRL